MSLDEVQKRTFRERGFIVVPGFFDSGHVARLSDWLDALRDAEPEEGAEARYYERSRSTGENVLVRVEHILIERHAAMRELLISPRTIEVLEDLLGEPPLLFKEKVNYKLPGGRADKLHQDQAAGWGRYSDFFVTMAVAVDANREENAAVHFMSSGRYERKLMTEEWQVLSHDDPPYQPEEEYTMIEANAGDAIFFDCYVPHGSAPNRSGQCRRNLYLTFNRQSDGDLRARYYRDKWLSYPPNQRDDARTDDSYRV